MIPNKEWCEEHHDAIIEIGNDVKWMITDSKRRNHLIEKHIGESDEFRTQVTRNTIWRHAHKVMIGVLTGVVAWIAKQHWGG